MAANIQDEADATACRAIQGHLTKALGELDVAKGESSENSNEQYVVIREQIRQTLNNGLNLAAQGLTILDPIVMPQPVFLTDDQTIISKDELEKLKAAAAKK